MPLVENHDIPRLRADIAHCQERIRAMQAGASGVIPASYAHQNAGAAFDNQLQARQTALHRLVRQYVNAMLDSGAWAAEEIIKRMSV